MGRNDKTDIDRRNRAATICYMITIGVITLAYLLEVFKGSRTVTYFIVDFLLMWIPATIVFIIRSGDLKHKINYVILIGFVIPWGFMLFTASNNLVFTYALVIMIGLNAYADKTFAISTAVAFNIVNIASVIKDALTDGLQGDNLTTAEIQILLILLCGLFNVFIARMGFMINEDKMHQIKKEKDHTTELLDQVMRVSGELTVGIADITAKMKNLDTALERTCFAMEEVSTGTEESLDSIQTQINMTDEIQNRTGEVKNLTTAIATNVEETSSAINLGNSNMNKLEKEVEEAVNLSKEAANELRELEDSTQHMQTIVQLINSVADQTALLALNASIEAARAGEAGRGFSVVAGEISNLANQTQSATGEITSLIGNVDKKLSDVDRAVRSFIDGSRRQHEATVDTVKSLETISDGTNNIMKNAKGLTVAVQQLNEANTAIVNAVHNISVVMEEVSSHSKETYESSVRNSSTVDEMMKVVEHLNKQTELLK